MTRGDSNKAAIAVLVARARELIQRRAIIAWFSRAPSELNPADLPTRDRKLPYKSAASGPFSAVETLFRLCRKIDRPCARRVSRLHPQKISIRNRTR